MLSPFWLLESKYNGWKVVYCKNKPQDRNWLLIQDGLSWSDAYDLIQMLSKK